MGYASMGGFNVQYQQPHKNRDHAHGFIFHSTIPSSPNKNEANRPRVGCRCIF
jgi:hypothetical protein